MRGGQDVPATEIGCPREDGERASAGGAGWSRCGRLGHICPVVGDADRRGWERKPVVAIHVCMRVRHVVPRAGVVTLKVDGPSRSGPSTFRVTTPARGTT